MLKKVLAITAILITILILSMVASYIFPGAIPFLDKQRLKIQAPVMRLVGNYEYGEVYMENGKEVTGPSDITFEELKPYLLTLKPGNIIVTKTRRYLSSEFIPGQWKHSAIFLGNRKQVNEYFGQNNNILKSLQNHYSTGNEFLIIDSNSDGVRIHPIKDLSNLSKVSLLNGIMAFQLEIPKTDQLKFINKAMAQVGKAYDFDLRMEDKSALFCSELLVLSLQAADIHIS